MAARSIVVSTAMESPRRGGGCRSGAAIRPPGYARCARRPPPAVRAGVVAGIGRVLDLLPRFGFTERRGVWRGETGVAAERTRRYVLDRPFQGDIWAYREG